MTVYEEMSNLLTIFLFNNLIWFTIDIVEKIANWLYNVSVSMLIHFFLILWQKYDSCIPSTIRDLNPIWPPMFSDQYLSTKITNRITSKYIKGNIKSSALRTKQTFKLFILNSNTLHLFISDSLNCNKYSPLKKKCHFFFPLYLFAFFLM